MKPNAYIQLLFEIFFFFIFVLNFLLFGTQTNFIFLICLLFLILGIVFWHTKIEIIRMLLTAVLMTICEIIATSSGIYVYHSKQILTVPLWLPIGWMFFSLITFRIIEVIDKILHIPKDVLKITNKFKLIIEICLFFILLGALRLLWQNTVLCLFLGAYLIVVFSLIYYTKMDHMIIVISIPISLLLEYSGIIGEAWQWKAPDLMGLPLWVPFAYSFINLLTHRISLELYKFSEK